jgi:hypothetical protein
MVMVGCQVQRFGWGLFSAHVRWIVVMGTHQEGVRQVQEVSTAKGRYQAPYHRFLFENQPQFDSGNFTMFTKHI